MADMATEIVSLGPISPDPTPILMTDADVYIDKDKVMGTVMDFKEYQDGTRTLRDLPRFDDCLKYGVSESATREILAKELDKLIAFAQSDSPPLFKSHGSLGRTISLDFAGLSGLADQIMCNLFILHNDNARAVVDQCGSRVHLAWKLLMTSRDVLQVRYGMIRDENHIEGKQPVVLDNNEDNYKAYAYLVDYIFGAIAWWLIRSVGSHYLKKHVFAILVQWSLKLKVVAAAPAKHAEQALSDTQDILLQYKDLVSWSDDMVVLKLGDKETQINVFNDDADLTRVYFEEKLILRSTLEDILDVVLGALSHSPRSGGTPDCFEVCTLIYRTGLHGVTTMVKSLRNSNVMATSDLAQISFCHTAYRLLSKNTKALPQALNSPPRNSSESNVLITFATSDDAPQALRPYYNIRTIDQMVSILVPNALMNSSASHGLGNLINIAAIQASFEEQITSRTPPPKDFYLEYTIQTNAWIKKMRTEKMRPSPDVTPLSESNLRRDTFSPTVAAMTQSGNHFTAEDLARRERADLARKLRDDYEANWPRMQLWRVESGSVRVNCQTYVAIAVCIAGLFVATGLAVCFTVGERIPGVDPGQLAAYSWLVAGAVIVIAKSRFVNSWPWHDFIKGRVMCYTLSDLSDVSGIEDQVILMHFLQNEWKTLLWTCGPYNGMFSRKVDTGGFSIDRPTNLSTMSASGCIVLKVRSEHGEHLICIDGRKGGHDAAQRGRKGNWLTCPDFEDDYLERSRDPGFQQAELGNTVFQLKRVDFTWRKVVGLYVKKARFG